MNATSHVPERIICCVQDVHVRDLIARVRWAIRLRWFFVGGCTVAGAVIGLLQNAALSALLLGGVAAALTAANLIYARQAQRSDAVCVGALELRRICKVQVLGDYLALAVVVYALGSLETPVMFLVLPNLVLAALFLTRSESLAIALGGLLLMVLPLALEQAGILPAVSLFAGGVKQALLADRVYLGGYLLLFAAIVLVCWYLVSEITAKLIRNELELEASYQDMVRLDEEKTRAMVQGTHELKAPLAAIKSYVYTLRDGYAGELPAKAKTLVLRIGDRCDRLMGKITDIIRLSNLKSYVFTGEQFRPLALEPALREVVEEARPLAEARQVQLRLRAALDGVAVAATGEHLKTLFENLVSNGINYSHTGGSVEVEAGCDGDTARVIVRDHGIGIPAAALPHVFDEHYRSRNAVAHYEHGTGLGLPIVRATARLLGAAIHIDSREGEGTAVSVDLPLAAVPKGE